MILYQSWVIKYTPLLDSPVRKTNLLYLPKGSIVERTLQTMGVYSEVQFITRQKVWAGWVATNYLEELYYEYPIEGVFSVPGQTPYPYDAAQYIQAYGGALYNLCGEGCVAWIYKQNIMQFLETWQVKPVSKFNQIIFGGKSLPTTVYDLKDMVETYGGLCTELKDRLYDPLSNSVLLSPTRLASILNSGYKIIVGCKIKQGRLSGSGIGHWIVVTKILPDGVDGGWVECYNPYPDRQERYSWHEFSASIGTYPFGLCVKDVNES